MLKGQFKAQHKLSEFDMMNSIKGSTHTPTYIIIKCDMLFLVAVL